MNINPFKRIADLEARLELLEANRAQQQSVMATHWLNIEKVEKQAAAAMSTASTNMDVMTKLPSIAVVEEAVALAKKFDERLDRVRDRIDKNLSDQWAAINELDKEMDARMVGAGHLDKRLTALAEDVVLLKALRNVVTPEEVSRKTVEAQIERDRAKQREYNAAYRARQKAKAEAEIRKAKRMEYQRAYRARRKAQKAAQEAAK